MARRTIILCNPAAGGGRAGRALPQVLELFAERGQAAESASSTSTAHLRELAAKAATDGYSNIVALGGDGAFHHVAEASFGHGVTLGFLPAGNGNDIAAGLGLPGDPLAAARVYLDAEPRPMDALRIRFGDGRTALCFGSGGLGLDAEAARLANGPLRWLPGASRYIAGALWTYPRFPAVALEAEIDGKPWNGKILIAAIANVPNYGGGIRIAPAAKADDGWMDLALIGMIGWLRIAPVIYAMLRTGELRRGEMERFRARRASFRTDRPVCFQGDGEVLGQTPLEAEILPKAIQIRAPR
ncbi:MAG TPA: diacylglycerol kinase family protein [Candidatus Acidoferrales bacterium]|nr:diacylglycerol kinase family protein [Candidatus Acidoferrales bacterium]